MLDHLQKFKALDSKLREAVSSEVAMKTLSELEAKFNVNLADLVIRLMVKEINFSTLPVFLVSEYKMELVKADELYQALRAGVFSSVLSYLEDNQATNIVVTKPYTNLEKPQESKIATFMIDPIDEEEVRELQKKNSLPAVVVTPDYESQAAGVIKSLDLSFSSEILSTRLKSIIVSYLKGIRNMMDCKQAMMRPFVDGGVQLDSSTADRIFAALSDKRPVTSDKRQDTPHITIDGKTVAEMAMLGERDAHYDLSALAKKGPLTPNVVTGKVDQYSWRQPKEVVGKVQMLDIKKEAPKVMSLLDELAFFDLIVFRRLSQVPEEATAKIKEKIELLEAESYQKRLEGVRAWRTCPLNKLYLKISDESVKNARPIEQVIASYKDSKDNLSVNEFVAIMKFNKEIRF